MPAHILRNQEPAHGREPRAGGLRNLRRLYAQLPARRKRQLVLLMGLMLVGAIAELLSLGAVIPFIAVLAKPAAAAGHPAVEGMMRMLGTDGSCAGYQSVLAKRKYASVVRAPYVTQEGELRPCMRISSTALTHPVAAAILREQQGFAPRRGARHADD